jgi:hypothetical protein
MYENSMKPVSNVLVENAPKLTDKSTREYLRHRLCLRNQPCPSCETSTYIHAVDCAYLNDKAAKALRAATNCLSTALTQKSVVHKRAVSTRREAKVVVPQGPFSIHIHLLTPEDCTSTLANHVNALESSHPTTDRTVIVSSSGFLSLKTLGYLGTIDKALAQQLRMAVLEAFHSDVTDVFTSVPTPMPRRAAVAAD